MDERSTVGLYQAQSSRVPSDPSFAMASPSRAGRSPVRTSPIRMNGSPSKSQRISRVFSDLHRDNGSDLRDLLDDTDLTRNEKELAIRLYEAARHLREWCEELTCWEWKGTFEHGLSSSVGKSPVQPYMSIRSPSDVLDVYMSRLDDIALHLTRMELDDLREQVMSIHLDHFGTPSRQSDGSAASRITLYSDFELFVTQMIVQTMPDFELLKQALRAWTTRLAVLQDVPTFLITLADCRSRLEKSWDQVRQTTNRHSTFNFVETLEKNIHQSRLFLEGAISDLGQKLDQMLDILEGADDRLPEGWIDDFEDLERGYGSWVAEAESKVLELQVLQFEMQRVQEKAARENKTAEKRYGFVGHSPLDADESSGSEGQIDFDHKAIDDFIADLSTVSADPMQSPSLYAAEDSDSTGRPDSDTEPMVQVVDVVDTSYINAADAVPWEVSTSPNLLTAGHSGVSTPKRLTVYLEDFPSPPASGQAYVLPQTPTRSRANTLRSEVLPPPSVAWHERFLESTPPVPKAAILDADITIIRRASTTSIESIPRSHVKQLNIRRHSSMSLNAVSPGSEKSNPSTPPRSRHPSWQQDPSRPISWDTQQSSPPATLKPFALHMADVRPSPVEELAELNFQPSRSRRDSVSSVGSSILSDKEDAENMQPNEAVAGHTMSPSKVPRPPLNGVMTKRRSVNDENWPLPNDRPLRLINNVDEHDYTFASPNKEPVVSPTSPSKSTKLPRSTSALPIQEQINELISSLPAPIRIITASFSKNESTSPTVKSPTLISPRTPSATSPPTEPRQPHNRTSSLLRAFRPRARPSTPPSLPTLTLTPVEETSRRRAGSSNPDIKIYHLSAPGRDKPIKLFIRRVGGEEGRLMVRVGGGWADLGEYLRVYAEHHMTKMSAEFKAGDDHKSASREGTPGSASRNASAAYMSSLGGRSRSATPAPPDLPSFADESSLFEGSTPNRNTESSSGPLSSPPRRPPRPDDAEFFNSSPSGPPSSAHRHVSSASRSGSGTYSLFSTSTSGAPPTARAPTLAGPAIAKRAKNREISDEKREWVDGIVEQARRTVSASHSGKESGSSQGNGRTTPAFGGGERSASRLGGALKRVDVAMPGNGSAEKGKKFWVRGGREPTPNRTEEGGN